MNFDDSNMDAEYVQWGVSEKAKVAWIALRRSKRRDDRLNCPVGEIRSVFFV